jgi:transposase
MAYDNKYRTNVIQYIEEGHTLKEARKEFRVGTTTIKRWRRLRKEIGNLNDPQRKDRHKKIGLVKLHAYYEEHSDSYLEEAAKEFGCSITAISKARKRLSITRKKTKKVCGKSS